MKILITGSNGQLGHDMVAHGRSEGHAVETIDVPDIDFTDPPGALAVLSRFDPEVIINCSAYTAVDKCETDRETAFAVNAGGPELLARFARGRNAPLIHFSTDYVFDGRAGRPYTEDDRPNPLSVYGQSKLAGETAVARTWEHHMILRIAWLYGRHGANFVKTIVSLARQRERTGEPLRVVDDQTGTPTFTLEVCRQAFALLGTPHRGVFHCTNEGSCTWFDFASLIVSKSGISAAVLPCATADFPRPAPRPACGVLENARLKQLGLHRMLPWKKAFDEFVENGPPL
jgi:dTDP-4-dehydrorhamnose reductase